MSVILVFFVFFVMAWIINHFVTKRFIIYAKRKQITDIPSNRSSHTTPTPRGGGVGFVITTLVLLSGYQIFFESTDDEHTVWVLIIALVIISVLGLYDDKGGLSKRVRFLVQFCVAFIILIFVQGLDWFYIPGIVEWNAGLFGIPLGLLWMVGVTNIYNFLDGVNGIATLQGIVAALAWCVFGFIFNEPLLISANVILTGTLLAFLRYNWTPAKIFMGDAGSVFLGLWFSAMPFWAGYLQHSFNTGHTIWFAAILLWPFLFDGSFTIFKRYRSGENILDAHRSHLYQRLHIAGWSHQKVSSLYGIFAVICMLFGLAFLYSPELLRTGIVIFLFAISLFFANYVRRVEQKQQIRQ